MQSEIGYTAVVLGDDGDFVVVMVSMPAPATVMMKLMAVIIVVIMMMAMMMATVRMTIIRIILEYDS